MFEVSIGENGEVKLVGRFDAAQAAKAEALFSRVHDSTVVDLGQLEYISSAGLGVLIGVQKRLSGTGASLKLVNPSKHIRDVFRYSGFDRIFEIE